MMKRIAALCGLSAFLILWACHLGPEDDKDRFDIVGQDAWKDCDQVIVVLLDGDGNLVDTLYQDALPSLDRLQGLDAKGYAGGKGTLHISGRKGDGVCFEQTRSFAEGGKDVVVEKKLDPTAAPTAVKASKADLVLTLESPAASLSAAIEPAWASPDFLWSLDAEGVVALEGLTDGKGATAKVKPLKAGKATVTIRSAKDPEKSVDVAVRVVSTEGGLRIGKDPVLLYEKGPSDSLPLSVPEAYEGMAVTWETGNQEVAVIDGQGRIKPLKAGESFVKATLAEARLSDVVVLIVKKDVPVLKVASRPGAAVGEEIVFSPTATQEFGSLVLYRWDFQNDGTWDGSLETGWTGAEVPLPAVKSSYAKEGSVTAKFQVIDSEGWTGEALVVLDIGNQAPEIAKRRDTVITIKDAVPMTATATDTDGKVAWVGWDYDNDGRYEDSVSGAGETEVRIEFSHVFPAAGPHKCVIKAVDGNGKARTDTVKVQVELDPPTADAGPDFTVLVGAPIALKAKGTDGMGRIDKVELKVGDGAFVRLGKEDTTFAAPAQPAILRCVVRVTDDDGLTDEDEVDVTVILSSNADLSGLELSAGALAPAFHPNAVLYDARVAFADSLVTLKATARDANASVTVNSKSTPSGSPSDPVKLKLGPNPDAFEIRVTAPDGGQRTYKVSLVRDPNGEATLSKLEAAGFALKPAFSPTVVEYADTVTHSSASITFKPVVASAGATLSFNGEPMASGTLTAPQALSHGENLFRFAVRSQDEKSTTEYRVRILRQGRVYIHRRLGTAAATLVDSADALVGASRALAVSAGEAYRFIKWSLAEGTAAIADSAAATTTITPAAGVVRAQGQFEIKRHTVTVSSTGCGTVAPGTSTFDHGLSPSFAITAPANCRIKSVKVDGNEDTTAYDGSHAFPGISAAHTLAVVFARTYPVTFTASGRGTVAPTSANVDSGTGITFKFRPNANCKVAKGGICDGPSCGILEPAPDSTLAIGPVLAARNLTVNFARAFRVTGSVREGQGTMSPRDSVVDSASTVVWRFTPAANHRYDTLYVDGQISGGSTGGNTYVINSVAKDRDVQVVFRRRFQVTINVGPNGSANRSSQAVDSMGTLVIQATPNLNYRVDTLTVDNVAVPYVGNKEEKVEITLASIAKNLAVKITFKRTYVISPFAGPGGTLTPASAVRVDSGGSQAFTITPQAGYHLDSLYNNSGSLRQQVVGNVYTFSNVTANNQINALFLDHYVIDLQDSLVFAHGGKYNPAQLCASWTVAGKQKDTCAMQRLVIQVPEATSLWTRGSDAVMDCSGIGCTNAVSFAYWEDPGTATYPVNPRTFTPTWHVLLKAVYRNDM